VTDPAAAVSIEPMRRRDLRVVEALASGDLHPPWSADVFRRELAQGEQRSYVVAWLDGTIVGYAGLLLTVPGAEAHITIIAVAAPHRGHGVARRLLLHLARTAIERGADALTLEVRPSNEPAMALYRRFGFAPEGVRKGYYAAAGEDALILWARDIQDAAYAERLARLDKS
jgi:ribosomal-protein-alanine N-acetyltransferase